MNKNSANHSDTLVVGGGVIGLACAYYLALEGHKVKIIDMLNEPGGTVAVGIPDYRMPRPLLQREADIITDLGVEIEYGVKLGRDVSLRELKEQYDAVFLGTGGLGLLEHLVQLRGLAVGRGHLHVPGQTEPLQERVHAFDDGQVGLAAQEDDDPED